MRGPHARILPGMPFSERVNFNTHTPPPAPSFSPVPTVGRGLRAGACPGAGGHRPRGHLSAASAGGRHAGAFPDGDTHEAPPGPSGRAGGGGHGVTAARGSSSPFGCRWRVSGCTCAWGCAGGWRHPGTGTNPAVACTPAFPCKICQFGEQSKSPSFLMLLAKSPSSALPGCAPQGVQQLGDMGIPPLVWVPPHPGYAWVP